MTPKRHAAILLTALLASCSSPSGPARVVETRTDQAPAPRGATLLRTAMLRGHNAERAAVGVAPLAWDETLADHALGYAREMARTGRFAHAAQPAGGPAREGENLFTGTRDAYRYDEMVQLWADEKRDFVNAPTPAFSRNGRWEDVAHYTQMVWRGSTRVGCALASNAKDDFLVCRYYPAGNVIGERAF